MADLIDSRRGLLAPSTGKVHVETPADIVKAADADSEPMVEVAVAEAMLAEAFQIGDERVAREVATRHTAEECAVREASARQVAEQRATTVAVDAQSTTAGLICTADASTSHYLAVSVGLAHGSSQTDHDAVARAIMDSDLSCAEARWMRGLDAGDAPLEAPDQERVESVEPEPVAPPPEESPPPVFADCSHYTSTASKPRVRRSRRALVW